MTRPAHPAPAPRQGPSQWTVAACAFGGLMLGLLIFTARGSTYEAEALVAVSNPARPVAGQVDNVTGPALESATRALGFRPTITVNAAEIAQLMTVTATEDDPERAALAANTVAEHYVDATEFGAAASIARSAQVPTDAAGLGATMFALIGTLLGAIAGISAEPVIRRRASGHPHRSTEHDLIDLRTTSADLRAGFDPLSDPPLTDHGFGHRAGRLPGTDVTPSADRYNAETEAEFTVRLLEPVAAATARRHSPAEPPAALTADAVPRRAGTFVTATSVGLTPDEASGLESTNPSIVLSDRTPAESRRPIQKSSPSMNSETSSNSQTGRESAGKEQVTRRPGLFTAGADRPKSRMFGAGDSGPAGPIFTLRDGPVRGTRFFKADTPLDDAPSNRNGVVHEPDAEPAHDPRPDPVVATEPTTPPVHIPTIHIPTPTGDTPSSSQPGDTPPVEPSGTEPEIEATPLAHTAADHAPPVMGTPPRPDNLDVDSPVTNGAVAEPPTAITDSGAHRRDLAAAAVATSPATMDTADRQSLEAEFDAARSELILEHNEELARVRSRHERQASELRTEVARLTKQLRIQASRLANRAGPDQTRVGDLEAQIDALELELAQLRQTLEGERITNAKKLTDERGAADRALDNIRRVHREELAKHLHTHRQALADHRNELDQELARDRARHAAALDAEHERYEAQLETERQRFETAMAGIVRRHEGELESLRQSGQAQLGRQAAQYKATIAQLRVVSDAAEERVQEVERENRMVRAALGAQQKQARHEQDDHAAAIERVTEELSMARADLEAERERNAALRADVLRRSAESHQAIDRAVEERTAQLAELEASVARQRQYADDRVREISAAAEEQARQAATREADLTATISRLKRELAGSGEPRHPEH